MANGCNVKIFSQDTDSTHLNYDDVDKIVKRYKDKYKLDLVGENVLQFHVDFPKKDGYKDAYSIEGLFLGKSYFDLLEYVDDNDKEHEIHDDLARMKGFPTSCIEYYAKGNKMLVLDVYKDLYGNKSIEIDLTNQCTKCVFRNTPEFNVKSLFYFDKGTTWTCRFIRDENGNTFIN